MQIVPFRLHVSLCVYADTVNLPNTCAPKCLRAKIPNPQMGKNRPQLAIEKLSTNGLRASCAFGSFLHFSAQALQQKEDQ